MYIIHTSVCQYIAIHVWHTPKWQKSTPRGTSGPLNGTFWGIPDSISLIRWSLLWRSCCTTTFSFTKTFSRTSSLKCASVQPVYDGNSIFPNEEINQPRVWNWCLTHKLGIEFRSFPTRKFLRGLFVVGWLGERWGVLKMQSSQMFKKWPGSFVCPGA